jgi:hypothetical protein
MYNRILINVSLFLTGLVTLNSCITPHQLIEKQKQNLTFKLNIPFEIVELEIIDERKDVAQGEIKLPVMSMPNQYRKHSPELLSEHKALIEQLIRDNFQTSETKVRILVTVKEAYKEFSASWSKEQERSFARIRIDLFDASTAQGYMWTVGSGDLFVQSLDAKYKRMEEMYRLVLQNATYTCLQQIKEGIKTKN